MNIKRDIKLLVCSAVCALILCGCEFEVPIFFLEDESSEALTTTTTGKYEKNKTVTTTGKSYAVAEGDDVVYTTSTRAPTDDELDFDAMSRVSVSTTTRKKAEMELTTTTTTKKSEYNTLYQPKSNEYYDITKQYRTSKVTQLRFGPSADYSAQLSLEEGTSLSCYGQSGKWYYVLYDNTTYGWVEEASLEGIAKKTTTTKK